MHSTTAQSASQTSRARRIGMRGAVLVLTALTFNAGGATPDSAGLPSTIPPMRVGDWYRPGATTTWQWQLTGDVNTSYAAAVYDLDLFETSAAQIASLHGQGRRVICYFSAGSSENWRPDFARFDRQWLGEPLDGWAGERWLDIRHRPVLDVMVGRLDLAKRKGCDGVEPDNVDGWANDTGFPLTGDNQLGFNRALANEAHKRGLAVGLKNDTGHVGQLLRYVDFTVNEQCHQHNECAAVLPFVAANKPVFNAEYAANAAAGARLARAVCAKAKSAGLRTLILPVKLDDAFRVTCE